MTDLVKRQLEDKVKETLLLADTKYKTNLVERGVSVSYVDSGMAGARAIMSGEDLFLVFNTSIMETDEGKKQLIDEFVPHEVAHLVNFIKPSTGRCHNKGWKNVCVTLGGSGSRTHNLPYKRARKKKEYKYLIGDISFFLGAIRHKRIQTGEKAYFALINGARTAIKKESFTGETRILD